MRTLLALTIVAFAACGGTQPKKEGAIVTEGGDTTPTCCCKTLPKTAEKEIVPSYTNQGRMECSAANGDCVDDVQCAGQPAAPEAQPSGTGADGVPPPPTLEPSTSTTP